MSELGIFLSRAWLRGGSSYPRVAETNMAENFTTNGAWGDNNEIKSLPCQNGEFFCLWRDKGGSSYLRACLHAKTISTYCYNNWKYDGSCFAIVIGWRRLTAVLEIDAGGLCGVGSLWNQVVHHETKWHSGFMTKFPPKVGFSCIFIIFGNLINVCTINSILR